MWIPAGGNVAVQDRHVEGGMIYAGRGLRSADGNTIEPSLIDPRVQVAWDRPDVRGDSMTYWPSYVRISPRARAGYLRWLQTGRARAHAYIGYVFLFFYGLERRLLCDPGPDPESEVGVLIDEVRRLYSIYGTNKSFGSYAEGLLDYLAASRGDSETRPAAAGRNTVRAEIAAKIAAGRSVDAHEALAYLRTHRTLQMSGAARRDPRSGEQQFLQCWQQHHPDGLIVPVPQQPLVVSYQPASAGIQLIVETFHGLPDPESSSLRGAVVDVLRRMASAGAPPAAQRRHAAPGPARRVSPSHPTPAPRAPAVALWARGLLAQNPAAVSCWGDFPGYSVAAAHGGAPALTEALAHNGVGVEPDPRFDKRRRDAAATIVVFDQPQRCPYPPMDAWTVTCAALRLAAHVATANGPLNDSETHAAAQGAVALAGMDIQHQQRAQARLILHAASPTDRALKKTAASIPAPLREATAALLVEVAACDGHVANTEMARLERIFNHLEMPEGDVYALAHQHITETGVPATTGLDRAKIAERVEETDRVQGMLAEVFADDTEPVGSPADDPVVVDKVPDDDPAAAGIWVAAELDARHAAFAQALCERPEWPRQQAETLAAAYGLTMLTGALDRINGAAIDVLGEPLAEGADPVVICPDALCGSV